VNVDPAQLLFDPSLKPLYVDNVAIDAVLENIGQMLLIRPNHSVIPGISGGPLGAYQYRLHEVHFHYGDRDGIGSEHAISDRFLPGEIQVYAYNADLYRSYEDAMKQPKGLVAVAAMLYVTNDQQHLSGTFHDIARLVPKALYKMQSVPIQYFSLANLLPPTDQYITYEGSLTIPGCYETVTWVLMNKPIYIRDKDLYKLRDVQRSDVKREIPLKMANNVRPRQPLNKRTIRTNIDFKYLPTNAQCRSPLRQQDMIYRTNPKFPWDGSADVYVNDISLA